MKITIELNTGGVAFDEGDAELQRILRKATDFVALGHIEEGESEPLFDTLGNRVGWVTLE